MPIELIDTHSHLPMLEHKSIEQVLADASANFVTRTICIGAADGLDSAAKAVELAEKYPNVWASAGVHPHDAGKVPDLSPLENMLSHPKVVAVGETGLDFFRDWSPIEDQRKVFADSIALAKNFHKPLIIHCRDAHEETIATLKRLKAEEVGGVFHCYAESHEMAKVLRDMNFLVSLTGIITFKNAHALRSSISQIPLEQIMLETDCPYMAPEPFRGGPSEPAHVLQIATQLAEIKGMTIEAIAKQTTATALSIFQITP